MKPGEPLLTAKDVAEWLGVHVNTVKRISESELPFFRIGPRGDRRYEPSAVEKIVRERSKKWSIIHDRVEQHPADSHTAGRYG